MCILTTLALTAGLGTTLGSLAATVGTATATGAAISAVTGATATVAGAAVIDIGIVAAAGALAGGITSTVAGIQNAEMQESQAEYQAEIAEQNAKRAGRQAEAVELQGNQKRAALLRESQQRLGTARAGYAAGGVLLGAGTAAEYEADNANAYDLDSRNLEYDIASEKWQLQMEASNHTNQAQLYRMQADAYAQQKPMTALGGAIQTIGNTASAALSVASTLGKFGGAGSLAPKSGGGSFWGAGLIPDSKWGAGVNL